MTLEEFYEEYTNWAVSTFGLDNAKHGATKLVKEAKELEDKPTDITEQADCLMCLLYNFKCAHPDKSILDLLNAANEKLQINKSRVWIKQPDGTFQHKKTIT